MAAQLGVFGVVYHPHTATTQFLHNTVVRNGFADHTIRTETKDRERELIVNGCYLLRCDKSIED